MVSCSASPKQQLPGMDFFIFFHPEWRQNVTVTAAASPGRNGHLVQTIGPWILMQAVWEEQNPGPHLTLKSEEEGKGGWMLSRQGSVSPEKRGILPSCFLEAREDEKRDRDRDRSWYVSTKWTKLLTLNKRLFTQIAFQKRFLYTRGRCWQKAVSAVSALKPAAFLPSSPVWWKVSPGLCSYIQLHTWSHTAVIR